MKRWIERAISYWDVHRHRKVSKYNMRKLDPELRLKIWQETVDQGFREYYRRIEEEYKKWQTKKQ